MRSRVVAVVAVEGGHVESHAEACLAVLQQKLQALVGVLRRPEPGEHPHGPAPSPVHGRMNPPEERKDSREPLVRIVCVGHVSWSVDRLQRDARSRLEVPPALRRLFPRAGVEAVLPLLHPFSDVLDLALAVERSRSRPPLDQRFRFTLPVGVRASSKQPGATLSALKINDAFKQ